MSIYIAVLTLLATPAAPPHVKGFHLRPVVDVTSDRSWASSEWPFLIAHDSAVIHWSCKPFRRNGVGRKRAETSIQLSVVDKGKHVLCRLIKRQDETDIKKGSRKASVAAIVSGTGQGKIKLKLAIADPFAAEGTYSTVVHFTVTAR